MKIDFINMPIINSILFFVEDFELKTFGQVKQKASMQNE